MASLRLIVLGCCFLAACQASAPVTNTHLPSVIPGEYLVQLKTGRVGLSARTQVTILNSFHINEFRALHVKVDDAQLAALREDVNVEVIEANAEEFHTMCNEQNTGSQLWGLSRTSSDEAPDYSSAVYQHLDEEDGSGVNAYIIDTGIYIEHNDFGGRASHGFLAPGLENQGNGDDNGHGTHCAGTTGGTQYGVAKGANLIAVKVLGATGSGSTSDVVAGVNYVANTHNAGDMTVVNLSLGMTGTSDLLNNALIAAINGGVHAAVAAGNSNGNACNYSPAQVEPAITVAASNNQDGLPTFTNWGTCCDCIAPGNAILSSYIGSPTASATLSGTSMAAPHVAGWVARYLSSMTSTPTPAAVKTALQNTGSADRINLGNKVGTPNYLPYRAC